MRASKVRFSGSETSSVGRVEEGEIGEVGAEDDEDWRRMR
jgi:hypothetical protein